MKQNVGSTDSFIRVMIGIAFYANIFALDLGEVGVIILFVLGSICMFTAWHYHCPAYAMTGLCSCSKDNECSTTGCSAGSH
jgi:hypothetical protein